MKPSQGERIYLIIVYVVLIGAALLCLLPLLHIVSLSLSGTRAVAEGQVGLYPIDWSVKAYKQLLTGTSIGSAFLNSVVITVFGVVFSMAFTILAAYPLSRTYFIGRRGYTFAIIFTMLFSGGLIPTYLTVKSLGLINSYWALWLPGLVSTFNLLVLRTFIENIPKELDEASRIDGCGEWRYLLGVVLPLSVPVLATLALFYGVGYWNSFFSVLMYINDPQKYNMAVLVQQMLQSQMMLAQSNSSDISDQVTMTPEEINSAAIVVMVLPMMVVYPFIQKHFVKGVMVGALKG